MSAPSFAESLQSVGATDWSAGAFQIVSEATAGLEALARRMGCEAGELASTLIVCLIAGTKLFVCHVGDGRGTYRDGAGQWRPLFTPTLGDSAGETVFVMSELITEPNLQGYIQSEIFDVDADVVCLLTDGVERASFVLAAFDEEQSKYVRKNIPYAPFFDDVPRFVAEILDHDEYPARAWAEFLKNGTATLNSEDDDKTLVVGLRYSNRE